MKDINLLKEDDIYNLILFAIFKLTNDPNYSAISELIYTLDKDNLLNLCSTFGGCVIKVPTLLELKMYTSALLLYQEINIKHKTLSEAFKLIDLDETYKKDVVNIYNNIVEIVENYGK